MYLNNTVTANSSYIRGGGIIGLYSAETYRGDRDIDKTSTVAGIDGARFINNTIRVGGAAIHNVYALGGVVSVSGLNQELIVNDTIVTGNELYIEGSSIQDVSSDTFYIGTDRNSASPDGHILTLSASSGAATEFRGNRVLVNTSSRFNSITFGREWDSVNNTKLNSKANARLNIRPQTGGMVLLPDPIKIDMNNGKLFTVNITGSGQFLWGGKNEFYADSSILHFSAGTTILAPDFQAICHFNLVIDPEFILILNTAGRAADVPFFHQPGGFTVTGTPLLEVLYDSESTTKEWLITDRRNGIDSSNFTLPLGFSLRTQGESLFLQIDNP